MSEIVGLWREPDGFWRWAYRSGETILEGNERHVSREEALEAARLAYPGVEIRDLPPRRPDETGLGDRLGMLAAVMAGAGAALGTAGLLRALRRRPPA